MPCVRRGESTPSYRWCEGFLFESSRKEVNLLPSPRNIESVAELEAVFQKSPNVLVTDYRGLTVNDLANLRNRLYEANVEYKVAKNTLTLIAAKRVGVNGLEPFLAGPTALAFILGDEIAAAKVLTDFARTSRILTVKGGVVSRMALGPEEVENLAKLPGRPQLQADLVGAVQGPMAGVLGALNAALSGVARALEERVKQLEPAS
jgi:large subunit ribosomal protein L10